MYATAERHPTALASGKVVPFPRRAVTTGASADFQIEAAQLIGAIAARQDRQAFALLFKHYAPRLKAYVMRLGANAELGEELAQETMLTVWRKAALYDPMRASASAWIFTILRNLRIDRLRRMRLELPLDEMVEEPGETPETDQGIDAANRAARLRAALSTLPAEQAEVVKLSFFDERPHAEIERALGIPLGTVKSRLRLAMAKLRLALKDEA